VQIWTVAALFFAVIGFFLLITSAGAKIVAKFLDFFRGMKDEQILVSIPIVIIFAVAFLSEEVGIAGVTGAFLAGMVMNKSKLRETVIEPKMKIIGYGFFIPLFFAYSAIIFDISALVTYWPVVALLLAVGSVAKVVGCGYFARFYKFGRREQLLMGLGMIPRGEYSIVIAQIALAAAVITTQIYTVMLTFVVLSILITPVLLKFAAKQRGF
jgi:Kef-type K+ transport system membrane component KefB